MARKVKIGKPSTAPWQPPAPAETTGAVFNSAPTARITPSFSATTGQQVTIFAGTSDDPEGDPITYTFTLVSRPFGSSAALVAGSAASNKLLTTDLDGDYVVRVTVTDDGGASRGATSPVPLSSTKECTLTATPATSGTFRGDTQKVEPRLASDPNVLWVATFDDASGGAYAFGSGFDESNGKGGTFTSDVTYVPTPVPYGGPAQDNGKVMRVQFDLTGNLDPDKFTTYGSARRRKFKDLPDPISQQRHAFIRYGMWIPADFNPVSGGKLISFIGHDPSKPLFGIDAPGGPGVSSHKVYNPYSWWTGIMWNGPAAMVGTWPGMTYNGDSNLDHIRIQPYLYINEGRDSSGNVVTTGAAAAAAGSGFNVKLRTGLNQDPAVNNTGKTTTMTGTGPYIYLNRGAWNTIEQEVKINDVGQFNGELRMWINGVLGLNWKYIKFADDAYNVISEINTLHLDIFFGGPYGAPSSGQYLMFDDLVISKAYIGPRGSI